MLLHKPKKFIVSCLGAPNQSSSLYFLVLQYGSNRTKTTPLPVLPSAAVRSSIGAKQIRIIEGGYLKIVCIKFFD